MKKLWLIVLFGAIFFKHLRGLCTLEQIEDLTYANEILQLQTINLPELLVTLFKVAHESKKYDFEVVRGKCH